MAKAALSSGGGGSNGEGVRLDWADALADKIAGPVIPPDAEDIASIRNRLRARGREWSKRGLTERMNQLVAAGEYVKAIGMRPTDQCPKLYYWPAAQNK